jgi:hypothetical protein
MTIQFSAALPLAALATATAVASVYADGHAPVANDTNSELHRPAATVGPMRFVPGAVDADAGAALGTGFGWAGYDGATRTPMVGATADVRLGTRFVIGAGATYAARDSNDSAELRPSVFVRYQILDQAHDRVDLGAAIAYRQDRFASEEGLLQGTLSLGMHGDTGALLASLGYGQDGEGDDHVGDTRLVALRHLVGTLHLGLDGHVQWLLESSDPNRALHGTPSLELTIAPTLTYGVGPAMLTLEVGWSGVDFERFRSGVLAVGGLGTSF